ncbi:MAG TPA: PIN domain-containing protein, partial [Verrucomicrobiae bacterium]|nr:PIN domain-containing protein [Verrucomicrobiae bacterium]
MKNYILDTNVLLHDPNSLLSFQDNNVLVPIEVIEEIDHFKRESSELGQSARTVSRMLDGLRAQGSLSEGVSLPNGGRLRIIFHKKPRGRNGNGHGNGNGHNVDSRIVASALQVQKSSPKLATILITKDINLRVKADAFGLPAEDYQSDRVSINDLYTGTFDLAVSAGKMVSYRSNGELDLPAGASYF